MRHVALKLALACCLAQAPACDGGPADHDDDLRPKIGGPISDYPSRGGDGGAVPSVTSPGGAGAEGPGGGGTTSPTGGGPGGTVGGNVGGAGGTPAGGIDVPALDAAVGTDTADAEPDAGCATHDAGATEDGATEDGDAATDEAATDEAATDEAATDDAAADDAAADDAAPDADS